MTSVLIFNKPPSVDAEIVEKCEECTLYNLRECRVNFHPYMVMNQLQCEPSPIAGFCLVIPVTLHYKNKRFYDNRNCSIYFCCEQNYVKVEFYVEGKVIEKWELNEEINTDKLFTLQYRVNEYLKYSVDYNRLYFTLDEREMRKLY